MPPQTSYITYKSSFVLQGGYISTAYACKISNPLFWSPSHTQKVIFSQPRSLIRKSTSVTMNVSDGSALFEHPVNCECESAQRHDPETEAVVINFNISTCAFSFSVSDA